MTYYSGHPDQYYGQATYSQHGEDLVFLNIFDQLGIKDAKWLDLGAHHPSRISNTKLLYERGHSGVNIEANSHLIGEFMKQRPRDKNIQLGVAPFPGTAILYMFDDFSGRNTISISEIDYVHAQCGMDIKGHQVIEVQTIDHIVQTFCADKQYPELLNCDVEGMDFDVLSDADFSKSSPVIICVEARDTKKMCDMMKAKAFYPYCRLGENLIFIRDFYLHTLTQHWPIAPFPRP